MKPISRRESTVATVALNAVMKSKNFGGKKMINSYMVEKKLGEGSFATVYLCNDTRTDVQYALKSMNKNILKKNKVYTCLQEELKVLATLEHPSIQMSLG